MPRSPWSPIRARLRAPTSLSESLRIERIISVARLLLATVALVQLRLNTIDPTSYRPFALLLLTFFAAHGASALLLLRTHQHTSKGFILTTSAVDLLTAALTLPIVTPSNLFFVFFMFAIATTAFRSGFRETMAMTGISIGIVMIHAYLPAASFSQSGGFLFDRLIGRVAYLAMIGLLLAYLAEEAQILRAESSAITRLLVRIRVESGLARATTVAAQETMKLFGASRVLLIMEQEDTHHLFRWDTSGGWGVAPATQPDEVSDPDRETYLFCPPELSIAAIRRRSLRRFLQSHHVVTVDAAGRVREGQGIKVPPRLASLTPYRRFISAPIAFGNGWSGRVFLFDPQLGGRLAALTQFLQTVVRQVVPALYSVHLTGKLQERAGALERARVARELHDGVIQSLIGVEMQLGLLTRQEQARGTPTAADVARLRQVVKGEVMNLRDLMQQMRPPEFDPDELLAYLADMVQRFGRDAGISAQFLSDLREVRLPWRVCFELVRIVQEGLVNVRKHSGASHVVVRFGIRGNAWALDIDDDGRGFPFTGRFAQNDLDSGRVGPTIIKERVRAIGGQLSIDSTPGRGSRLEILVPQVLHG